MLSFRYKSNDHFWFTLFHEIAHVLLHRKKMLYLETEIAAKSEEETEADKFAGEILIPPRSLSKLREITLDEKSIREFADELSIPAGIILGRLQKKRVLKLYFKNLIAASWSSSKHCCLRAIRTRI